MKTAKLLGYTETSEHQPADYKEYREHDEGGTEYKFFVAVDTSIYYFTFNYSYGSCGSGWCGASWGSSEPKLIPYSGELPELTEPKNETYVNVVDDQVQISIAENTEYWDSAIKTQVKSTTGEVIVYETGDGGCQYYSSGIVHLSETIF